AENPFDTSDDDEFSNILIADAASNGNVIFQQDYSEFHLISLDKLTLADDEQKVDFAVLDKSSGVVDIKLAGSKFKLFLHPINLPVVQNAGDGKETRWIVGGLVPSRQFQRETWAISYSVLIAFAFLPALLFLIWPFLKLMLIGPKDRLRTADVYFLAFSILIGLFFVTSLGLYAYSYLSLESQMDDQLAKLSEKIRSNFKKELSASLQQLDLLTSTKQAQDDLATVQNAEPKPPEPRTEVFKILDPKEQTYPYFDT